MVVTHIRHPVIEHGGIPGFASYAIRMPTTASTSPRCPTGISIAGHDRPKIALWRLANPIVSCGLKLAANMLDSYRRLSIGEKDERYSPRRRQLVIGFPADEKQ